MADGLNTPAACTTYFRHYVVKRLRHWRDHAAVQTIDIALLDHEQEHILKALTLGVVIAEAWTVICDLIVAFAPYMERRGHWETWHVVLQRAIEAAQRLGAAEDEITLTTLLAKLCQRQSRQQEVVRYYARVIRLARRMGNRYAMARACSNLGYFYIDGGHWWRSEVLSLHALSTFEALASYHGRAHTHNHLGTLAIRMHNWPAAETHLIAAYQLWTTMPDRHSLIYGCVNLALLYNETARSQLALPYLAQAEALIRETGETAEIATVWSNMAHAYRLIGDFAQAILYAGQAAEQYQRRRNWHPLARVWHNLALVYLATSNLPKAIYYREEAQKLLRQCNDPVGEKRLLEDYQVLAEKSRVAT